MNRDGKDRLVDISNAKDSGLIAPVLLPGEAYTATGSSFASGALQADAIYRAKCRQHNDIVVDPAAVRSECTGDQWPPDKDLGQ
jgi:hypothetical protein